MTSVRKSYISKYVKNRKLLLAEKLWNVLAFEKESKKSLITYISRQFDYKYFMFDFRVEICFIPKWKCTFDLANLNRYKIVTGKAAVM